GNNSLIHNLDSIPGISSQGKYNFTVNCEFRKSGGSKLSKEQALTLIYDIQAPEILNFSSVNTCMLNELDIKWTAKDAISTITGFLYKINANNAELFSWKETTKKEARIDVGKYDSPNITANTKYTITVAGKDSAGNIDMTGKTSQEIKLSDPFAKECLERVPPKSNITKEFRDGAAFITLTCQDLGGSGCNSESFLYGATGPSTTCSASQKYTAAVKVTNTAIFCWKVSDNAGNTHQGEQKITLNLDSDGDGIPDGIDKCPNTAKSERADQTGCAPSQKDDDDDGISNDKDICPETIQEAIDAQTINSSGCIKDSDNDGMPDYWEMKYKFDINDASDASKNPDLDGANNLQEYRQGTDPLVSDVDAGQIPDKDGDGVPDTLDKCPETASGDTVNPQTGCSKKDLDKDQDGMSNECEKKFGLDSENADDAEEDNDDDGLTNLEECEYENCELELDPNDADTDEDGYIDGKEKEEETSPCDAEDKPASLMLQYVLLVLGILFLSAGTGYLAYKRFILKESLSSSGLGKKKSKEYKLGSLDYPQSAKASLSQGSKAGAQHRQIFVKKQATAEEKRKAALQKIKDERKQGRTKELGRAFSGFGDGESSKENQEIKKIEMPSRRKQRMEAVGAIGDASKGLAHTYLIHPAKKASASIRNIILPDEASAKAKEQGVKCPAAKEMRIPVKTQDKKSSEYNQVQELAKSNTAISKLKSMTKSAGKDKSIKDMVTAPISKLKEMLPAGSGAMLENLTKKKLPLQQLKRYTLHKIDIEKIIKDGKQEKQAVKIFSELASMNRKNNQKAEAFTNLSSLMQGQQDVDKKDVFKDLPKKLVPETSREAAAFTKLSNLSEGKPVDDGIKELSKLRARKTSIDYLKMLAGKR
ncbi:fibronectin type III domain-containing protein, partial [Candidatus Woesearchaeota archaeon]|nr:fibronectin type III domain-containing protein [Candidatus Woesearchaeota archaeon]